MTRFQKIASAIAILLVIGGATGWLIYYFTQGVSNAASAFFETIATSGPETAYRSTSPAFQAAVDEPRLATLVEQLGLRRFRSASWPHRQVENGEGSVRGTLSLEGDVTLPAEVRLTKDASGQWRVYSFDIGKPGPRAEPAPPSASPGPAEAPQRPAAPQPAPAAPTAKEKPSAQPQTVESTSEPGDEIAARIGDDDVSLKGTALVVLNLGGRILINGISIGRPGDSGVKMTTVSLQFDDRVGVQTLSRDCQRPSSCIEINRNGDQFKSDLDPKASSTMEVTKSVDGVIEGTFSADMVSLDGKLTVRQGRFRATTGRPAK